MRNVAGELILVPIRGGVGDLDAIFTMNEVAAAIWKELEEPTSAEEIAEAITTSFDVDREQAERDVRKHLETLSSAGMIREVTAP